MTSIPGAKLPGLQPAYLTARGEAYLGDALDLLGRLEDDSVNLILASPPLPRPKDYGHKPEEEFVAELSKFARLAQRKLRRDGSLVLHLSSAYRRGVPARSLHSFRALLHLCDDLGFYLAQDFYWHNPRRPLWQPEWVNKRKLRVRDGVDTVWWLGKTEWPKANVANVLVEHPTQAALFDLDWRETDWLDMDGEGLIPPNLIRTAVEDPGGPYLEGRRALRLQGDPSRLPAALSEFFIRFLTEPGDEVVNVFDGSNAAGLIAEREERRWLSFEANPEHLAASAFRFLPEKLQPKVRRRAFEEVFARVRNGDTCDLRGYDTFLMQFVALWAEMTDKWDS
ncbi:site-specific DNA-methyltransferase [Deinococcus metallilatus]|uniref:Methyltransferase n=1 Tax=Deinococcus metallilatus TaxID=1211322 RepID=A0AAJ5F2Y1_9DEIO|nr:site-specific DNA-methyltransferase [Deinococcus metallilatus]MBB5295450.1 site-specific DNA-methyltransferase (cytosine-N4-specific) [Deinococcus metallilatus]QBY08028.1 site-specific DNA-methyltransferase [Deinococcus metallilatus]RXJ12922.1 site-specific DNA-methyltransferase [Deinococcus metallilatus]TLK27156.1 site-specific DNA-methyltransferase [Deinococcus metallilatus]